MWTSGGVTVGILGCGVDVLYPTERRSLMEASSGGELSGPRCPWAWSEAERFPPCNKAMGGFTRAVVVVEGEVNSGAVITAHAAKQGRLVFALEVRGLVRQFPGKNFARQPYGPGTERSPAGGVAWPNHSSS
jgi:predicted Rossmann fold nucleotide-binding protein DprA/Smf involved in DNA uptake